jgi:6-hydroxytryprostatin B O-methyltransferase
VSGYLATNYLPQPSFEANRPSAIVPVNASPNVQLARQKLLVASLEIFHLATGPIDFLPNLATNVSVFNIVKPLSIPALTLQVQCLSCLTWLCQYKIFHLILLHASISYDAHSTASKVSVQPLKAITRVSMTTDLFREDVAGGSVVHYLRFIYITSYIQESLIQVPFQASWAALLH